MKFTLETDIDFVKAAHGNWLAVEGVKFDFNSDGTVSIKLTQCIHDEFVIEQFLEPNNGKNVMYYGVLPV